MQVDGGLRTGPRRRDRRAARRRRVRLLDRAADRGRLRDDARVPPQHLPGRRRDAGPGAAQALRRPARARHQLLLLRRRGSARDHGRARLSHHATRWSGRCRCSTSARWSSTGRQKGLDFSRAVHQAGRCRRASASITASCRTITSRRCSTASLIAQAQAAIDRGAPVRIEETIRNTDRTAGAMLSGDDRQALRPHRTAGRHHPREAHRHRRAELRRVARARHHVRARGRGQRLCRQGPLGRAPHRLSAARGEHRAGGVDHRRQHRAVRRDRGRVLFPRHRGRALRGAQLRRHRGGRRRGRPLLRIHDRRRRGGARQDRPQLRGRHVGRHRLCARRGQELREALQHVDDRARAGARRGEGELGALSRGRRPRSSRARRRDERHEPLRRRAAAPAHRQPRALHALRARAGTSWRRGTSTCPNSAR